MPSVHKLLHLSVLIVTLLLAPGQPAAAGECSERLFVSGYASDNVHLFDLCGGGFERTLDTAGRLDGVQAVRIANGFIYVASEENDRVVRYNAESLAFVDIFADTAALNLSKPTALAVGPDGDIYVGAFATPSVVRLDGQTGASKRRYDLGGQVAAIDAGMAFHPDGRLLIPGFDSSNVLALDVDSGAATELIAGGTGGLNAARVIVDDSANQRLLVTSWRGNRVLAYGYDGSFIEALITRAGPSGLAVATDGTLLVTSDQLGRVIRYGADGSQLETVLEAGAGGVDGATFLALTGSRAGQTGTSLDNAPEQAWLIGVGAFENTAMTAEMVITDGTAFGDALMPASVRRLPWGTVTFELLDCGSASLSWDSVDPGFGAGGYPLIRVAPNLAQRQCEAGGISADASQGTWFGGAARDGEGLMVDVLDGGQAVLTWYTYRLASAN